MIKKIICFLLNLIMSLLVLILICICLFSNTIFSEKYMQAKLVENHFYERAYADIKEDFENYTMQSGLELDILEGLITKEKVKNDINAKLEAIYQGKKIVIETNSIRDELDSRINEALEKNNRVPSTNEKESIQKYENAIVDSYQSGILYGRDFSIDSEYFHNGKIICIVGIVLISIVLIVLNKSILKYVAFIGINCLFSGILCILLKCLLIKRIANILFLDAKFSNLLVNTLNDILLKFYHIGIIATVIGCVLIVIGSFEKFKKTIENKKD